MMKRILAAALLIATAAPALAADTSADRRATPAPKAEQGPRMAAADCSCCRPGAR